MSNTNRKEDKCSEQALTHYMKQMKDQTNVAKLTKRLAMMHDLAAIVRIYLSNGKPSNADLENRINNNSLVKELSEYINELNKELKL